MTKSEFNLIIIESLAHEQRQYFFKARQKVKKRKDDGYSKTGFCLGLLESFKWLNTEVNKTDYSLCKITEPDGRSRYAKLSSDTQIKRKQMVALEKIGKLSFPFKKVIEIRNETNGQLLYKLTNKSMASLCPNLHVYIFPCFDSTEPIPSPPVLITEGHDKEWDKIIEVPKSIARRFPNPESGLLSDEETDHEIHKLPEDEFVDMTELFNDDELPKEEDLNGNNFMNHERDMDNSREKVQDLMPEKLSLNQIALKYAWEGIAITRENRDKIALQFGYKSGNKLHQNYCKVMRRSVRISDPDGSATIMLNKMGLFESVIAILPEAHKKEASEELNILQSIFETSYLKKF